MFLTTQEVTTLFRQFDVNKDRKISYKEFIETLRGDFSEKRISVVKHVYGVLSS